MELARRREVEITIDEMRIYGDGNVQAWLNQCVDAMRNRKWDEAERTLAKAKEEYVPPAFIENELVRLEAVASRSQARRLINGNQVFVDGKRVKLGANVQGYGEIKVGSKVFKAT